MILRQHGRFVQRFQLFSVQLLASAYDFNGIWNYPRSSTSEHTLLRRCTARSAPVHPMHIPFEKIHFGTLRPIGGQFRPILDEKTSLFLVTKEAELLL